MKKEGKVKKTMKDYRRAITGDLSDEVADHIKKCNRFSLELAIILDIKQSAVLDGARRRSNKLLRIDLLPVYEKYGYKQKDLYKKNL